MTCTAGNNTSKMAALMRLLKRDMNGAVTESMERRGIAYPCNWGVSLHAIRKAAGVFAHDHDLARFLYGQQIRELQLSAYVIADPSLVTEGELTFWGARVTNAELAENLAFQLLSRTELTPQTIGGWLCDETPVMLKYCALMTLTRMSARTDSAGREYIVAAAKRFVYSEDTMLRTAAENILSAQEAQE